MVAYSRITEACTCIITRCPWYRITLSPNSHDGFRIVTVCSNASNVKFENSFVLVWFDLVLFAFDVARVVGHIITLFKIVFTRHKHLSIVIILFHPWYLSIWFFLFSVCSWMLHCVYFSIFFWFFFSVCFFFGFELLSLCWLFFFHFVVCTVHFVAHFFFD